MTINYLPIVIIIIYGQFSLYINKGPMNFRTYVGLSKIILRVKLKIKKNNLLISFHELLVEFFTLTISVSKWIGNKLRV